MGGRDEMKKAILLFAVLMFTASSFADTIINNFNGYNDGYYPFGDPRGATQTYGEIFTAPDSINDLNGFSFYMGDSYAPGSIITGAYVATWTGTHAGTLLYSSPQINYDNVGNEEITINPGDVLVTPGQQYVILLSTSQYSGQSMGEAYATTGNSDPNLNGFAYFNNGRAFESLFLNDWSEYGLSPDWAVNLSFTTVPEPSTLVFVGTGILGGIGVLRRKLF